MIVNRARLASLLACFAVASAFTSVLGFRAKSCSQSHHFAGFNIQSEGSSGRLRVLDDCTLLVQELRHVCHLHICYVKETKNICSAVWQLILLECGYIADQPNDGCFWVICWSHILLDVPFLVGEETLGTRRTQMALLVLKTHAFG
jgi:hypothetical protein